MKVTMEYMIGNTAIQLVNTGKKVKIIDVEKQKTRRSFLKHFLITMIIAGALAASCFYIVRLENQKVLLNQSVYSLQCQIHSLSKENQVLKKEDQELTVDYETIYKKAKALGMKFPTEKQIGTYIPEKSTAIHVDKSLKEE